MNNKRESETFDLAEMKKVGMIQQKQKKYFALRLRAVGGNLKPEQFRKIAEISEVYGDGSIHITTRQGVEIHNVHHTDLEQARKELEEYGIKMGACGPRVRIVVACPGSATCRWGSIETKEISDYLDKKYFGTDTPHKFKMSVTGCPHNCAKASENDIGVMGGILPEWTEDKCIDCNLCVNVCPSDAIERVEGRYILNVPKCINCSICTSSCPVDSWIPAKKGYILHIGGTMGKMPRIASRITGVVEDKEFLKELIDRSIEYYRKNGKKKERFGHMIDRIGLEIVKKEIVSGTKSS